MLRRLAVPTALVALVLLAAGCSNGSGTVAAQANAGDGKGYVAGDGSIEQLAPAQRKTAIRLTGDTPGWHDPDRERCR